MANKPPLNTNDLQQVIDGVISGQMEEEWLLQFLERLRPEPAPLVPIVTVEPGIKPLEWVLVDECHWGANTAVGGYEVRLNGSKETVRRRLSRGYWETFDGTIAEAKADAQAFHNNIVRTLLDD